MRRVVSAFALIGTAMTAVAEAQSTLPALRDDGVRGRPRVQLWVVDERGSDDRWDDRRDPNDRYDARRGSYDPVVRVRLSEAAFLTVATVDRLGTVRVLYPADPSAGRTSGGGTLSLPLRADARGRADDLDDARGWGYVVAYASASPPAYDRLRRGERWRATRVASPRRQDPGDAMESLAIALYPHAAAEYDADFAFVPELGDVGRTAWRSPYVDECAESAARWGYSPWRLWSSLDEWCRRGVYSRYGYALGDPYGYPYGYGRGHVPGYGYDGGGTVAPPPPPVAAGPDDDGRDMAARDARRGLRPVGPPPPPVEPRLPGSVLEPWGDGTTPRPSDRRRERSDGPLLDGGPDKRRPTRDFPDDATRPVRPSQPAPRALERAEPPPAVEHRDPPRRVERHEPARAVERHEPPARVERRPDPPPPPPARVETPRERPEPRPDVRPAERRSARTSERPAERPPQRATERPPRG